MDFCFHTLILGVLRFESVVYLYYTFIGNLDVIIPFTPGDTRWLPDNQGVY
jgi:hypothetical protein